MRNKTCGGEWNLPVTASPCQPPLGKGAKGAGVRIATGALRPRNDRFYMGCGANGPSGTPAYGGQQGVRGKVGRADVGIGPYGGGYKGRNGRVVQETGPTKFYISLFFLAKIF